MTTIYYYVLPMLLGRTYDMKTDSPGVDIFPKEAIDNPTKIVRHFTDSQYRMVSDTQEARDFLGVSGALSLKIKSGRVPIEGLGNYMRETFSRSKTVEILVKVHYETETLTLPSTASPRVNWKSLDRRNVGTHYVRSITYGGDLVASLRFTAKNSADVEKIRAAVQANLQADSGSFGLGIEGNFSRLQEDLKDSSTLEINYYATVPIKGVPNTMESLMELVEDFPAQTELVNNGTGVPLSMELFPLSALDADVPRYLETQALVDQLDQIESQFDDIRATKKALQEWLLNVPPVLSQELEDEIGEFNDELERISLVFYQVLGNLDMSEEASVDQFQLAFDSYRGSTSALPDKYYRKFLQLRHKIIQSSPALTLDVGGAIFTHFGRSECNSTGAQTIFSGIVASTDQIRGGAADLVCLSSELQTDDDTRSYKKHPRFYSKLSPVQLQGREGTAPDLPLECSECLVEDRTAASMFPGRTECPPAWTLEYSGFISAKEFRSRKGALACVDGDARVAEGAVLKLAKNERPDLLSDVKVSCGGLDCERYTAEDVVPCVVCTY